MSDFMDALADLYPDTVTYQPPGTLDEYGRAAPGTAVAILARVAGKTTMVRTPAGEERVSTVQAWLAGAHGVAVGGVFTLPARFAPRQPKALAVEQVTDETGPIAEKVFF